MSTKSIFVVQVLGELNALAELGSEKAKQALAYWKPRVDELYEYSYECDVEETVEDILHKTTQTAQ